MDKFSKTMGSRSLFKTSASPFPFRERRQRRQCHPIETFFIQPHLIVSRACSALIALLFLTLLNHLALAQTSNEKAEMKRLETQAHELIILGDSNGAALSIGKAAMMARILATKELDRNLREIYVGTEDFFRTQENGYRAMAIFQQAGGKPPAPKSACQLLNLAKQHNVKAHNVYSEVDLTIPSRATQLAKRYVTYAQEWSEILEELKTDFACS